MKPVLGLIGCGYMGQEYAKALRYLGLSFDTVYSRNPERATQFKSLFDARRVANSIRDLLESSRISHVIIAVSDESTFDVYLEALTYPKAFLVEKPLGLTLEESLQLQKTATANNADASVALNRRGFSSVREALRLLASFEDTPRFIGVVDQEAPAWIKPHDRVTGQWHFANSIHLVDLISLFGRGDPAVHQGSCFVSADGGVRSARIQFDSGDIANYVALWNRPGPWSLLVSTKNLYLELCPIEGLRYRSGQSRDWRSFIADSEDHDFKPGLVAQLRSWLNINGQVLERTPPTISETIRSVRLLSSLYSGG